MSWYDDPIKRATTCRMCGGLGYVETAEELSRRKSCPLCGATMFGTKAYEVHWNSKAKQFDVVLAFPLPAFPRSLPEFQAVIPTFVALLPAFIAENSRCSCGSSLEVGDHNISLNDLEGVFRGSFLCPRCRDSGGGALAEIRKSVTSVWRQIVRVKVGPTGVEFEKSSK